MKSVLLSDEKFGTPGIVLRDTRNNGFLTFEESSMGIIWVTYSCGVYKHENVLRFLRDTGGMFCVKKEALRAFIDALKSKANGIVTEVGEEHKALLGIKTGYTYWRGIYLAAPYDVNYYCTAPWEEPGTPIVEVRIIESSVKRLVKELEAMYDRIIEGYENNRLVGKVR